MHRPFRACRNLVCHNHLHDSISGVLHDATVCCRLARVAILVISRALVFPSLPSIVKATITHEPIIEKAAVTIIDHVRSRRIRTTDAMVVSIVMHWYHGTRSESWSSPAATHDRCVTPLSRYRVVATSVASNQLVASPWALHHFDSLAVCETAMACGTGIGRSDQRLIGLAVGTVE
jgi:hypothetical protein